MPAKFALAAGAALLVAPAVAADKHALVIGVNDYAAGGDVLKPLKHAERNAEAIGQVLEDHGYEVVRVTTGAAERGSRPELRPTRRNVGAALDGLLGPYDPKTGKSGRGRVRDGDSVMVFMSGHGLKFGGDPRSYYCPADAAPDPAAADRLLALEEVVERLRACPAAARFLLVDACRNEPDGRAGGPPGPPPPPRAGSLDVPSGVHVLLSCRPGQKSFEDERLQAGVFSYFVLQALRGEAGSQNGVVTWDDVSRHVRESVPKWNDRKQVPVDLTDRQDEPVELLRLTRPAGLDVPALPGDPVARRREVLDRQRVWAAFAGKNPDEPLVLNPNGDADQQVTLDLSLIPGGKFRMGDGVKDDEVSHPVELTRHYFIGKTEVTQRQMRVLVRDHVNRFGDPAKAKLADPSDLPADSVSYEAARQFCDRLNGVLELYPQWGGYECRLPTEAEWEFACRAGTATPFHFGPAATPRNANLDFGFNKEAREALNKKAREFLADRPLPQAEYAPNDYGLRNMHGNVAEWCSDWYAPYPGGAATDPTGPPSPTRQRVLRGGHYNSDPEKARSAARLSHDATDDPYPTYGFRVVIARRPAGR